MMASLSSGFLLDRIGYDIYCMLSVFSSSSWLNLLSTSPRCRQSGKLLKQVTCAGQQAVHNVLLHVPP
jgi:hypothetical protein